MWDQLGPIGTQLEETITGWNELEARDWGSQVDDVFSAKGDSYICDFPYHWKVGW